MDHDRSTLIIFDWDDTLLPSSWLRTLGLLENPYAFLSDDVTRQLDELSILVVAAIKDAQKYGRVIIITNGMRGWVEKSCHQFMPRAEDCVTDLTIISAQSSYDYLYANLPMEWKRIAFQVESFNATNIISIGDSQCEQEAVKSLMSPIKLTKAVKLSDRPTPELVKLQLILIAKILGGIVKHGDNMDIICGLPLVQANVEV